MGRFSYNEADNYGGKGGHGFFSLKEDKEVAKVRFLYNSLDDISGYAVHEVQVNGKKRYVDCKRESYNSPVDDCPFCKAGKAQLAKMFIPVYRVDTQEVQIWERGKKFFTQLEGLCRRLPEGAPMCAQVYEIERNGKPKDTQTTYGIYPIGVPDDTTLESLPESGDIIGGLVLNKSEDDMNYYLHTGEFPEETETSFANSAPSRSVGTAESYPRRTPARGDRF